MIRNLMGYSRACEHSRARLAQIGMAQACAERAIVSARRRGVSPARLDQMHRTMTGNLAALSERVAYECLMIREASYND